MDFMNLGGLNPCSDSGGFVHTAKVTGRDWRTTKGLRIGDTKGALRRAYKNARLVRGRWWLVTAVTTIGASRRYPVLAATVTGGRVTSFSLFVGSAGD
jgi:hypothetical protein